MQESDGPVAAELLVIGGRSGVGKSSVAFEVSAQLALLEISHAVIEGDFLDFA
jgi:2-phosphoglycerate kinase